MDESHVLCENHKAKCPCGSLVAKMPSRAISILLQDLPCMCQNYENGCQEIKMDAQELEHHQEKCIFRQVFCPTVFSQNSGPDIWYCKEKKVMFKDVREHLLTVHKNNLERKMVEGEKNKWIASRRFKICNLNSATPQSQLRSCPPTKIISTDGDVFYDVGFIVNNAFYYVIYFYGSPEEAKNFSWTIFVQVSGKKFTYTGKVHTLDEKEDDIIASETCFKIGNSFVNRSLNEGKVLFAEFSIRNLKEEAKDDDEKSCISDNE